MSSFLDYVERYKCVFVCTPIGITQHRLYQYIIDEIKGLTYTSNYTVIPEQKFHNTVFIFWSKQDIEELYKKLDNTPSNNAKVIVILSFGVDKKLINTIKDKYPILWPTFCDYNFSINVNIINVDEFEFMYDITKDKQCLIEDYNNDYNASIYHLERVSNFPMYIAKALTTPSSKIIYCYYNDTLDDRSEASWLNVVTEFENKKHTYDLLKPISNKTLDSKLNII